MKILVTGGAGYIGSHFLHLLLSKGFSNEQIIVFDNFKRGFEENIPENIKIIKGNLKNKKEILNVFLEEKIDCVIHFAAYAYVNESMKFPEKYFYNNIVGGLNLLEGMRKGNCKKIIFSSSCATYGIPNKIPIDEETKQKPINPYGESKLIFEKFLKWYEEIYSIKFVILRYFNVAGADFGIGEKHEPETHLIPLILRAIIEDNPINIFGKKYPTFDGTCIRDYIHITDLANAHYLAMNYIENKNSSTILNLGTGKGNSILEIIKIAEEISQKKVRINFCKEREGDPPILIAGNSKAKEIIGWVPRKTITEIIKSAYDWETKRNN